MRYAKIINGEPCFAPNPVTAGTNRIGNPPGSVYTAQGYKAVQETPYPAEEAEPGCRWELQWVESADALTQSWVQRPVPPDEELSGEEALNILLGGDGA